jgi:hypothetical protein
MKHCRHGHQVRLLEVIDDPHQDKIYMGKHFSSNQISRYSFCATLSCHHVYSERAVPSIPFFGSLSSPTYLTFCLQPWNIYQVDKFDGQMKKTNPASWLTKRDVLFETLL